MKTPLEITYRNVEETARVDGRIRERVTRLEQIFDRATFCHVVVEAPGSRHRKGDPYEIRIELRVPGTELAVNHKPGNLHAHDDIMVAVRDAFGAMEQQLKKWKDKVSDTAKI